MNWWCWSEGTAWTWAWRPYLGAWGLVVALALGLGVGWRRAGGLEARRALAAVAGLVALLAAVDWPLAALGAGYLVTAQMARQVLVVLVAAPLLLYGCPPQVGRALTGGPRRRAAYEAATHPVVALGGANLLLIGANAPLVTDALLGSQLGSFGLDAMWFAAGVLLWLPVQPPLPLAPRLAGPAACGYLILQSVAPLAPAFFMTWADFPLYATYELAPPVVAGFDALDDQQTAAALFQVGGGLVIWAQIAVRFVGWLDGRQHDDRRRAIGPAPRQPTGTAPS